MTDNPDTIARLDQRFPCLICGKRLEAASCSDEDKADMVVAGNYGVHYGIPFDTVGAYGSQILDGSSKIFFVLCDICLLQRRHRILGQDHHDEELKEGFHNGVKLYEKWLNYIKEQGSDGYWDNIKDGEQLI